jgi:dsDNA-specific endonuclease/ATPase MutS2
MNERDRAAAFLGAQLDPHISIIDLHTFRDIRLSLEHMEHALYQLTLERKRYCRVVHGIGNGVLSAAVHKNLAKNKQIIGFSEAEDGGSCVVLF